MKNDATQIQIRDISEARNCELISSLRRRLNKLGIRKGLTCVFSRQ
jgi:tRNA A37 threonylcarbamoyladenosine dehydratase